MEVSNNFQKHFCPARDNISIELCNIALSKVPEGRDRTALNYSKSRKFTRLSQNNFLSFY